MVDLYVLVSNEISKVTKEVYPEQASSDAQFPYVVYDFPTTTDVGVREDIILEVNIWDSRRDGYDVITGIEQMASSIDEVLKNVINLDDSTLYKFERLNRLNLKDPEPNIFRRQLRYRVKKY